MARCRHYTEQGEKCLSTNTAGSGTCGMFCDLKVELSTMEGSKVLRCYEPPLTEIADKAPAEPNFRRMCEETGQHTYIHFESPLRLVSACTRCGDVKVTPLETYETREPECGEPEAMEGWVMCYCLCGKTKTLVAEEDLETPAAKCPWCQDYVLTKVGHGRGE